MESQIEQVIALLRGKNLKIREQALDVLFQYSETPEVVNQMKNPDFVKPLVASLYENVKFDLERESCS